MGNTDRRIKRTQRLLQEALIALTLEKGYEVVTIRDITDRADVGYATFFRHYDDKGALLADVIQSMKEEFQELLVPHSMAADPETAGLILFQYVRENCDLCKVLLDSTNTMELLKPLQKVALEDTMQLFESMEDSSIPTEIAAIHLMSSLVMLVRWWLENDMPYPPERMGEITADLIIRPVANAML